MLRKENINVWACKVKGKPAIHHHYHHNQWHYIELSVLFKYIHIWVHLLTKTFGSSFTIHTFMYTLPKIYITYIYEPKHINTCIQYKNMCIYRITQFNEIFLRWIWYSLNLLQTYVHTLTYCIYVCKYIWLKYLFSNKIDCQKFNIWGKANI